MELDWDGREVRSVRTPDLRVLPRFPARRQGGRGTSLSSSTASEPNHDQSSSSHHASLQDSQDQAFRPQSLRLSPSPAMARPTHTRRRTASSSTSPSRRLSRPTTLQRVASGIRHLTGATDDAVSEDWSVFGEVMGPHEGSTTTTTTTTQKSANTSSRGHSRVDGTSVGTVPIPVPVPIPPARATGEREALYSSRRTYSPVSIRHPDDHPFAVLVEGEVLGTGSSSETGRHAIDHEDDEDDGRADSDTEPTSASSKDTVREEDDQLLRGGGGSGAGKERQHLLPTLPTLYRNILKCSFAYFLGSLFTYYSPLARFIADLAQDGPGGKYLNATGHMVATV
jgi:hypothetical protein